MAASAAAPVITVFAGTSGGAVGRLVALGGNGNLSSETPSLPAGGNDSCARRGYGSQQARRTKSKRP